MTVPPHRPTPTTNPSAVLDDVATHGFGLLAGALDAAETADVRARLYDAADRSEAQGMATRGYSFDPDTANRRVFMLFNLDPIFIDLIVRPIGRQFVTALLGESFLISNFSANITGPGGGSMGLHADQGYVPPPWAPQPFAVNVGWILDDYTDEVGATRYVPGSHLLGHGPDPATYYDTVPIEAAAGSILVMDGRLWHQTGPNRTTDRTRAAAFGYYVLPWIRPQVNWTRALDPSVAADADPAFLELLGYDSGNVAELAAQLNAAGRPT